MVQFTGVSASASVTLTATLGAAQQTATLRVLGASEAPAAASASRRPTHLGARGAPVALTVSFDIPVASNTVVGLSSSPLGHGSLPTTATVLANQTSASFGYTLAPNATGQGTVTASFGLLSDTATVDVDTTPATNHVVLSEVATKGPAGATDEFIELYNPTNAPIAIGGWEPHARSAAGPAWSDKHTIAANTSLRGPQFY